MMSDRKRVLTLNFSAGVPFPHTPPTLGWGRGDPASGGGQSCRDESPSKEERGKETEMRRDTKRDSHWRDREKNTTHTHTHTHTRTHHVGGIHKLTRERKSCTSIILKQPPLKSTCGPQPSPSPLPRAPHPLKLGWAGDRAMMCLHGAIPRGPLAPSFNSK